MVIVEIIRRWEHFLSVHFRMVMDKKSMVSIFDAKPGKIIIRYSDSEANSPAAALTLHIDALSRFCCTSSPSGRIIRYSPHVSLRWSLETEPNIL